MALPLAVACHAARPEGQPDPPGCVTPAGRLPASATAGELAGAYQLHLVATDGPRAGAAVDADLELHPLPDSLVTPGLVLGLLDSTVRHPLAGSLSLDPDGLGAVRTGSLTSSDDLAPGALVIERQDELTLRLGADANRRGPVRYDGGYFALALTGIGSRGFTGTWASGAAGPTARGYFCAERTGSD